MKKFLGWIAVFVLIVGGAVLAFWPVNHWRLYDADWQPLALTNAENYCAGAQGMKNGFDRDDKLTKECTENSSRDNVTPSIANSPQWACEGVVSSGQFNGSIHACVQILHNNSFWLIAGGGLTFAWNDERPRPQPIDEGVLDSDTKPRGNRSDGVDPSFTDNDEGEEEE